MELRAQSRRGLPWLPGEPAAFMAMLRTASCLLPCCTSELLLGAGLVQPALRVLGFACVANRLTAAVASRLLSRVVSMLRHDRFAAWCEQLNLTSAHLGAQRPHGEVFFEARALVRTKVMSVAKRAGELPPWSSAVYRRPASASLWDELWRCCALQEGAHRQVSCASSPTLDVSLAPIDASAVALGSFAEVAPVGSSPVAVTTTARGSAAGGALPAHPRTPRPRRASNADAPSPMAGRFYWSALHGFVYACSPVVSGVLCLLVGRDLEDVPEGYAAAGLQVETSVLSRHGSTTWREPAAAALVPRELREAACAWEADEAAAAASRRLVALARDARPGGVLATPPPRIRGRPRHPLLDGHAPHLMHLLLLPRVPLTEGFVSLVGGNVGPRRTVSDHVLGCLRLWNVSQCAGGVVSFWQTRTKVRAMMVSAGLPTPEGAEAELALAPEDGAALVAFHVTVTLTSFRGRHLIYLDGSAGPQYLGVSATAALMGVTETTAPPLHGWLMALAEGAVRPEPGLAPLAAEAGTMRAVCMLGLAMHLGMVERLMRHAEAMVREDVPRLVTTEHFAGLAVATAAAARVWPQSRATFFSDLDNVSRSCLRACYPGAFVCSRAEDPSSLAHFPKGAFLLIAGFPCSPHSPLARRVLWEDQVLAVDVLLAALAPLAWGDDAPTVVLLENVTGILSGVYDLLCRSLSARFPDYRWMVGVACPSLHADSPSTRGRVYWLAIRTDRLSPPEAWPRLGADETAAALQPFPLQRGLAWGRQGDR